MKFDHASPDSCTIEAAPTNGGAVPDFGENRPEGATDFNDLALHGVREAVQSAIASAKTPAGGDESRPGDGASPGGETNEEAVARLASMTPMDYDRVRETEAKRLGVRVATLDGDVRKARGETCAQEGAVGGPFTVIEIAPWPESVDLAKVLDEVADTFTRYLVMPRHAETAMALWCAHAHGFRAFEHSPRLNIRGPQKRCGKTTAQDVLSLYVPRPVRTENLSTAVFFRIVHRHAPTLLIDEYDAFLRNNEELRGALNAGHKRGGEFHRCEGKNEPMGYGVFAPVVLTGIQELPGTLHDRSLVIEMARATKAEMQGKVRFDSRRVSPHNDLNRKLARWAADNFADMKTLEPALPDDAYNRVSDNWRPIFAIAQLAGQDWPQRVMEAYEALKGDHLDAETHGVTLLVDIRQFFEDRKTDRVFSVALAVYLAELEERPWAEWGKGKKPISTNQIARLLRQFKIRPGTTRQGKDTFKGYSLESFEEAFSRYLPPPGEVVRSVTPSQPRQNAAFRDFGAVTSCSSVTDRNAPEPAFHKACDGVTDQKGERTEGKKEEKPSGDHLTGYRLSRPPWPPTKRTYGKLEAWCLTAPSDHIAASRETLVDAVVFVLRNFLKVTLRPTCFDKWVDTAWNVLSNGKHNDEAPRLAMDTALRIAAEYVNVMTPKQRAFVCEILGEGFQNE